MIKIYRVILLFFLCLVCGSSKGQLQLFDFINNGETNGSVGLVELEDEGWVTIFLQSQPIGSIRHDIVLAKFGPCGEPVDSKAYHFPDVLQLAFAHSYKDIDGTFWVLMVGQPLSNFRVGVLIHFDEELDILASKKIVSPTQYYAYTMDRNANGELVIFGNVSLESGGGTLLVLNDDLTVNESKRIMGSSSWGSFLPTSDGGYLCRNGVTYYKLDNAYNLIWINNIARYYATNVPLEVDDGYIFSIFTYSSNEDQNFLIKFDKVTGEVIWKSPNLLTKGFTRIRLLDNGNIMQIGKGFPDDILMGHVLFSEIRPSDGTIVSQRAFNPDLTQSFHGHDFIERENGSFVFAGTTESGNAIIQSLTTPSFSLLCGDYQYAQMADPPVIEFFDRFLSVDDMELVLEDLPYELRPLGVSRERICFENILSPPFMPIDSVMCLGDSLTIDLRFIEDKIFWSDGSLARLRRVGAPADLEVTVSRCDDEMSATIFLTEKDCSCSNFLPNIFTPNGDNVNDVLGLLSTCALENLDMKVFDRWGGVVFQSNEVSSGWTGRDRQGQLVANGVYVVNVQFTQFENGQRIDRKVLQNVTVVR